MRRLTARNGLTEEVKVSSMTGILSNSEQVLGHAGMEHVKPAIPRTLARVQPGQELIPTSPTTTRPFCASKTQ